MNMSIKKWRRKIFVIKFVNTISRSHLPNYLSGFMSDFFTLFIRSLDNQAILPLSGFQILQHCVAQAMKIPILLLLLLLLLLSVNLIIIFHYCGFFLILMCPIIYLKE